MFAVLQAVLLFTSIIVLGIIVFLSRPSGPPDISEYFAEFNPTPKQLKRLTRLVEKSHKGDTWAVLEEAVLMLAPGDLSRLTPAAYDLLKRCQGRKRAFDLHREEKYEYYYGQAFNDLVKLLLDLGLIIEAMPSQKLSGSQTMKELKVLLEARGLSIKGKKDVLVNRLIEHLPQVELDTLIANVILFRTTEAGDQALQTIKDLFKPLMLAFSKARRATSTSFWKRELSVLPPGVLYDDGEVRITEEDVERAKEDLGRYEGDKREVSLNVEVIEEVVKAIEASDAGWLTITPTEQDAHFVQAGYLEGDWTAEVANIPGVMSALAPLGFVEEEPCPLKSISDAEVAGILIQALEVAFGVVLGDRIRIEFELAEVIEEAQS